MTRAPPPHEALEKIRKQRGLKLRAAAREIGCSHPALKKWESGGGSPTELYRLAIEQWTNGRIKAASWPPSLREREEMQRISDTRLGKPKDKKAGAAVAATRSGTDG